MNGYFICNYMTEEGTRMGIAYWISEKGYCYKCGSVSHKIRRISEEEYISSYDAHMNY